jgi:hypothetical protein
VALESELARIGGAISKGNWPDRADYLSPKGGPAGMIGHVSGLTIKFEAICGLTGLVLLCTNCKLTTLRQV